MIIEHPDGVEVVFRGGSEDVRGGETGVSDRELVEAARAWRAARARFMQVSVREWRKWDAAHGEYLAAKRRLEEAIDRLEREEVGA